MYIYKLIYQEEVNIKFKQFQFNVSKPIICLISI